MADTAREHENQQQNEQQNQPQDDAAQQPAGANIDYGKIQQMLDGTLKAKEETALKAYFKQQGLSQQEAEQAIADFKAQKAKNTPNIEVVQQQLAQAQQEAVQAQVANAATVAAVELGLDAKAIPYVLRMADFGAAIKDGKIDIDAVKAAVNQVLDDLPQLKPQSAAVSGFVKVGADGGNVQNTQQSAARQQTPTKRWNRFNT